jgi:PKHD-type hydroxylase
MNYLAVRILQKTEVDAIVSELAQHTFSDGKRTAQGLAREVKNNLQLTGPQTDSIAEMVAAAMRRSAGFQGFAIPRRVARPIFSRYDPGMEYGTHIDHALMGELRTDLSVTLFLSAPETYDGGELVIQLPLGNQEIKLDAGEAIIYPSSCLHHVAPVTRGVRLAGVTWVQSSVRDEAVRGILYDLHQAIEAAAAFKNEQLSLLLGKSFHNLLRYAADS